MVDLMELVVTFGGDHFASWSAGRSAGPMSLEDDFNTV